MDDRSTLTDKLKLGDDNYDVIDISRVFCHRVFVRLRQIKIMRLDLKQLDYSSLITLHFHVVLREFVERGDPGDYNILGSLPSATNRNFSDSTY